MSADSALAIARGRALTRMVDRCTITRPGALSGPVDPVTGLQTGGSSSAVYSGACFFEVTRVQNPTASDVAGDFPVSEVLTLMLPANAGDVRVQDVVTITAAPDHVRDVGRRLRVSSINTGTQLKQQRCQVEVITG
jgi:hypothetical protein